MNRLQSKSAMQAKVWLYDVLDAIGRRTGWWKPLDERTMSRRELEEAVDAGEREIERLRDELAEQRRAEQPDHEIIREYESLIADCEQRLRELRNYVADLDAQGLLKAASQRELAAKGAHHVYNGR